MLKSHRRQIREAFKSRTDRGFNFKYRLNFDSEQGEFVKDAFIITGGGAVNPATRTMPQLRHAAALLELFNITSNDSNIITLFGKSENTTARTAQSAAEGRDRSDELPEAAHLYFRKTAPLRPIGVWQPVSRETLQDNARFEGAFLDSLLDDLQREMLRQIFTGGGSPNDEWNAMGVNVVTIAEPARARDAINMHDDVRARLSGLLDRGIPIDALMGPSAVISRLSESMSGKGVDISGDEDATLGRLLGVPLRINPYTGVNALIIGSFKERMEIALHNSIEVMISADALFTSNEIAGRATVEGETIVYNQDEFLGIRNTNNYAL